MAYPREIPPLSSKGNKEFLDSLKSFKLTKEQQRFWETNTDRKPFKSQQ